MSKEIWFEGFLPSVNPKMARYIRTCAKCIKLEGRTGFLRHLHHFHSHPQKEKKKNFFPTSRPFYSHKSNNSCMQSFRNSPPKGEKTKPHTHTKRWSKSLAGIKHKYGWVILNCLKLASSHLRTSKIGDACSMSHRITSQNKGATFSCATFPVLLSLSFTKEGCFFF